MTAAPRSHVALPRLLSAASRIVAGEETNEEDLALVLAPGTSLGGARPEASVRGADRALLIAKFFATSVALIYRGVVYISPATGASPRLDFRSGLLQVTDTSGTTIGSDTRATRE